MTPLVVESFLLALALSYSSAHILTEFKSHFLWKTNFALISLLENPFAFAESAATLEEGKMLKEKISSAKKLIEDLNENLEKMKKSLSEQKDLEKEVLDRIKSTGDKSL